MDSTTSELHHSLKTAANDDSPHRQFSTFSCHYNLHFHIDVFHHDECQKPYMT